jgi:toxin ParE1/3/4
MTLVRISGAAADDLDEIWFYIASDSPLNADRFLDELVTSVTELLSVAPLAGRAREEFGTGLRSLPFHDYLIFYRVRDDDVDIVRIIHGRRDLHHILTE